MSTYHVSELLSIVSLNVKVIMGAFNEERGVVEAKVRKGSFRALLGGISAPATMTEP